MLKRCSAGVVLIIREIRKILFEAENTEIEQKDDTYALLNKWYCSRTGTYNTGGNQIAMGGLQRADYLTPFQSLDFREVEPSEWTSGT